MFDQIAINKIHMSEIPLSDSIYWMHLCMDTIDDLFQNNIKKHGLLTIMASVIIKDRRYTTSDNTSDDGKETESQQPRNPPVRNPQ